MKVNQYIHLLNAVFLAAIASKCLYSQPDFVAKAIDTGYGADGTFKPVVDSFPHKDWDKKNVYFYSPESVNSPVPTIFFCHGIGQTNPSAYIHFINHIVSKGYNVIYSPYKALPLSEKQTEAYNHLLVGFEQAVKRHSDIVDTTKVGFVGHSFGGGAVPYITRKFLVDKKWGNRSAFMFIMAPWFICEISQKEIETFPDHVKLVIQVYDDDVINDPRIAKDFFENVSIPLEEKVYIIIYSDSIPNYKLKANHSVPICSNEYGGELNILDFYGVYRSFDALASYSFNNDIKARRLILDRSPTEQPFLGFWPDGRPIAEIIVTKKPFVEHPQNRYVNFWDHTVNPRSSYSTLHKRKKPFLYNTRITLRNYYHTLKHFLGIKDKDESEQKMCPVKPICSGFGSIGQYFTDTDSIPIPCLRSKYAYIFSPRDCGSLCPVIMFAHSFRWSHPKYFKPMIKFIVSKGYILVFPSFKIVDIDPKHKRRYDLLFSGYREALELYKTKIDTTRIGFIGHSFGGGAVPAIAWRYLAEKGWGKNGAFLFMMAPWFMYHITQSKLETFPSHAKLIVQVYADSRTNDWRIGKDIFDNINVPPEEKDFIVIYSDSNGEFQLDADHSAPHGPESKGGEEDAIDYYGVYRLIDALAEYSFYGNLHAKKIALGNNCPEQRFMGKWPDCTPIKKLLSTDKPDTLQLGESYIHSWDSILNHRKKEK